MRHLNKIVFLNSANIPRAEVMLDGNVHFSGTQSVGKSTVLRALLFFYNADKMRLGIQQGQKSFEEFYFRYSNSYIIYEVKTEQGAYSILTYRSQGKAVFRFIDAPYQNDWFVDEDGHVESDWIRIRERIGSNVDISSKIDTYEQYRNIIFGNTHDRSHRFDKYAIVESSKYQNIPRSIQNVFLNSKLDADFVKNTIIQSMAEDEDSISLSTYRHLVADFEREFDEIECWYRKDTNGQVPVRIKASKVIETNRLLSALEYEMKQTWHQLNYAVNHAKEQQPIVEDEIRELQDKQKKIKEKLDGAHQEYEKEHDKLTRDIATIETRLTDIRKKRKHYDEIGINAILELDSQEQKIIGEKTQKDKLLQKLEEKYKDIAEKYRALYDALETEEKMFVLGQKEAMQSFRDEIQIEKEGRMKVRDNKKKAIDNAYNEWMNASDDRLSNLQQSLNNADKHLSEVQYWHPMATETADCKKEIQGLKTHEYELKTQLAEVSSRLTSLRQEWQIKNDQKEQEYDLKRKAEQAELDDSQAQLEDTEDMLGRWKGSLYEWLTKNKPDWEENIGKVVDEKQVLYAQNLSPQLADEGSLFGVNISLEGIPTHHRTPDEYLALKKELLEKIETKRKAITELQAQCEKEIEAIRKSYRADITKLQQEETTIKVQLEQIPLKIKDFETRLHQFERKEQEMITAERDKRNAAYSAAVLDLEREKTARTQQRTKRDKDLKAADNEFNQVLKDTQKRIDAFRQKQGNEASDKKKDISDRKQMFERQEREELKGKGADTNAIELCRKDILSLQRTLDLIGNQKHFVIEYRKDEEELFNRESVFREDKRRFEAKDADLRQQYDKKKKNLETSYNEKTAEIKERLNILESLKDGLKQYDQLCQVENIIPEAFMLDATETHSSQSCKDLVVQMRGAVNGKRQKMDELKRAINAFNTHFGANNTFHFITPQYDEEYLEFALNLQEFVENDKIEMYRSRVSEHYNTVLHSVSREVGLLMNHSAEIRTIINEVNRDFQERNFAGVIKSIELRAEESSDRMMLLLKQIRDFTEENALSIGELNLFSGEDRDRVNQKVVEYLKRFMKQLQKEPSRTQLSLSDTFRLQFRIQENDNNTGWVERINNVGSDGTDVLVKAMVNIMLINVFKTRASRKQGDFVIHCMMDEIGKLHPSNVSGILQFANVRNIYLINSSPMGYNADLYKYNYLLTKDGKSQTHIKRLVTINA